MKEEVLLVAIGCGRLSGILEIAARFDFVVFGVMGGQNILSLEACPVYLYETG